MTTEEKTRAYDMALEAMSDIIPDEKGLVHIRPSDIFPELAESEDERIRKVQLDYWRSVGGKEWHGVPVQETIAWLEKQGEKPQVDGFDAELNALLKKYEHLSKKELQEPLEFYLGVVRDDLDVVREERKPMWNEEDEAHLHSVTTHLEQWIERHPNTCGADIQWENLAWLKSLKQRMEEQK